MTQHITAVCGALVVAGLTATAQAPQPSQTPSPATTTRPQASQDRTKAGDTLTVTGCIAASEMSKSGERSSDATSRKQSGGAKPDATSRYRLTSVQRATAGAQGADTQMGDHHMSYALTTDGSTVDLSQHVNHKVELTGTLDPTTGGSPQAASTGTSGSTGTATVGRDANAMGMPPATLKVASLKMVSTTCP